MKIGFEAKRATHNRTGLGNYSRLIINLLTIYFPKTKQILYTPSKGKEELCREIRPNPQQQFVYPQGIWRWKPLQAVWRSKAMIRQIKQEGVTLFHGLSGELPAGIERTGVKSVVTIHDLIFLRFPQYYQPIDRTIYTRKFRSACRRADRVIAVTECTKRDLVHFLNIDPQKIAVVYQGCDERFKQPRDEAKIEEIRIKYDLPDRFVLNVGTVEERKNIGLVLRALSMQHDWIPLIVVGQNTPYGEEMKRLAAEKNVPVRFLHNVSFADLPTLYQAASLFVYPSRFEGFGIPILEAIHAGLPVVAASGSCLEEAAGEGAWYVAPDDDKAMCTTLVELWNNEVLRDETVKKGRAYVQRFEPEVLAEELMKVYKSL